MRILVVTTTGVTVNSFLLPHIRQLQSDGHEVEIACEGTNGLLLEELPVPPRVHELSFSRNPMARQNGRAYAALRRLIANGSYDVIHTHTPVASTLVRLAARTAPGVRVFYTAHGFHFFSGAPALNWLVYYPIERILSRVTDTLITVNSEDYERARRHFRARRLFLSPGVGIEARPERSEPSPAPVAATRSEGRFTVLSIGELNANKGHATVIRAIASLRDDRIVYLIAGSGHDGDRLRDLARELGVAGQVRLLGQRRDVEQLLDSVDAYVHPSYREGLPVAVLEAMRAGLPIVASDIRGCRDALRDGVGLLVPSGDPEAFAGALRQLQESPALRGRLGTAARGAVQRFEIDRVLEVMRDVYAPDRGREPGDGAGLRTDPRGRQRRARRTRRWAESRRPRS